ncbi:MAG: tryptophan synthase subunit alpha [Peptococcaceae bacterium]|nr:tryptophan synthase subunit alpha [Peptococcaceae bacterium]
MDGKIRIAGAFARLREKGEKGLITYVTAGYPGKRQTIEILKALADAGSDLIEIGVPFSDPIADGPVIQRASHLALAGGVKLADIFDMAGSLRKHTDKPVLLMTYYNPVFRAGTGNFVRKARDSGVDGLIVPDLPVEEDGPLRAETGPAGLALIPLVAPNSSDRRLEKIAAGAEGFIYCVSVKGVTGSRKEITTDLKSFTDRVKRHTGLPLAVGFGISGPEAASRAAVHCDAVVVGSAIMAALEGDGGLTGAIERAGRLAGEIKEALKQEVRDHGQYPHQPQVQK